METLRGREDRPRPEHFSKLVATKTHATTGTYAHEGKIQVVTMISNTVYPVCSHEDSYEPLGYKL